MDLGRWERITDASMSAVTKNDWPTSYAYSSQKVTRKVQNGWQGITSAQQWLRSATVWPQ